ncbi:MAG TPA: flagellar filament capping protein FliD [bacterium]|nr:flagellar filament capping protein FliD [bacterium]HOL54740.1 flagellar filament capping protein FliD [bacterium]HPO81710.1 flagellar filament capping protein FliD [bacterium]
MADSLFNIWGLASGIDTNSIIESMVTVAKTPVIRYQNQQSEIQWKQEIWSTINTRLQNLQSAVSILTDKNSIVGKRGISSNDNVLSVSTTGAAPLGTYTFEVVDIAMAHTVTSNVYASRSEKISFSDGLITINGKTISVGTQASLLDIAQAINQDVDIGQKVYASVVQVSSSDFRLVITSKNTGTTNSITFGGESNDVLISLGIVGEAKSNTYASYTEPISFETGEITINGETINIGTSASLQDIVDAINNDLEISTKVKARITQEESSYRVSLISLTGSIETLDFSGGNDVLKTIGVLDSSGTLVNPNNTGGATTQLAKDLELTVSGISGTIIRQSNTVTDLFEGVTLNIKNTGTSTVTVVYDTSQAISNIENFVNVYNDTLSYIRTKLTEEREEGIDFLSEADKEKMTSFEIEQHNEKLKVGLLRNDSTLIEIEDQLRSIVTGMVKNDTNTPLTSTIRSLEDIGISIGNPGEVSIDEILAGKLTIDYEALNKALTESPETVADLFSKSYVYVQDEVPQGTIDGTNTRFTLNNKSISYDIRPMVYSDGVLLTQVFGETTPEPGQFKLDYTTGTLILGEAPTSSVKVSYGYNTTGETAGIAVRINNLVTNYTKDITGIIPYTINTLTTEYKELNELISDTNIRLSLYEENLIRQFVALEEAIAKVQSQSSFLSSYLTGLQKQGGSK